MKKKQDTFKDITGHTFTNGEPITITAETVHKAIKALMSKDLGLQAPVSMSEYYRAFYGNKVYDERIKPILFPTKNTTV